MKRFYFISQLLLCCFVNLIAQNISSYEVEDIATRIFQMHNLDANIKDIKPLNTSDVATLSDDFNSYLYVVETLDEDWVVLAADSVIPPILAMGSGGFPAVSDMPPAMVDLFNSYIDEIKYIIDTLKITTRHPEWDLVFNPNNSSSSDDFDYDEGDCLLNDPIRGENFWKQSENNETDNNKSADFNINKTYNKFCPLSKQDTSLVGCGAIVMGQIMWYWQWPNIGIIPDTIFENGENRGIYDINYYNWDLMPNAIYDDTPQQQADMIASLLRDCGYATKMKYSSNKSSTSIVRIKDALIKSFNYKAVDIKEKEYTKSWGKKLRQELKNGRPIIYSGANFYADYAHVFVVDGYKGFFNNLFHINWGSGKSIDPDNKSGFYRLNNLSPEEPDNWLFEEKYNYNYYQYAIFGLEPDIICGNASDYGYNSISNQQEQISTAGSFAISSVISNNSDIIINSGSYIELRPGFMVKKGCDVYLNVLPLNCETTFSAINYAPQYEEKDDNMKTVKEELDLIVDKNNLIIGECNNISSIALYNLQGQIIIQSNDRNINLPQLSTGIYIIKVFFEDGNSTTKKIVL